MSWILQVHCVQNSHLGTLQFANKALAYAYVEHVRQSGLAIDSNFDNTFEFWPPHLLGVFDLYESDTLPSTNPILVKANVFEGVEMI